MALKKIAFLAAAIAMTAVSGAAYAAAAPGGTHPVFTPPAGFKPPMAGAHPMPPAGFTPPAGTRPMRPKP